MFCLILLLFAIFVICFYPNVFIFLAMCVCVHVYVVYEDTDVYNDMGMTQVLQGEGDL